MSGAKRELSAVSVAGVAGSLGGGEGLVQNWEQGLFSQKDFVCNFTCILGGVEGKCGLVASPRTHSSIAWTGSVPCTESRVVLLVWWEISPSNSQVKNSLDPSLVEEFSKSFAHDAQSSSGFLLR